MMHFLTFEDRSRDLVALKLLVLSMADNMSGSRLHIPTRRLPSEALDWLKTQPNVTLHSDLEPTGTGWNIKPSLLLQMLAKLGERITWIDADIIVRKRPMQLSGALPSATLVVAEEGFRWGKGSSLRTKGLKLVFGRELGYTVNSCVVSATVEHRRLLEDWLALSNSPDYLAAQSAKFSDRPRHIAGDQDLLTGLLGSKDYENIDLVRLRSGKDIAHCMGAIDYPLGQRLRTILSGEPSLVHAQASKVWTHVGSRFEKAAVTQQSLYRLEAKKYLSQLSVDDRAWLFDIESPAIAKLSTLLRQRPSLVGVPFGIEGSYRIARIRLAKARASLKIKSRLKHALTNISKSSRRGADQ